MEQTPVYATRRKPGMYRNLTDAITGIAALVLSSAVVVGVVYLSVTTLLQRPDSVFRVVVFGTFAGCAWLFVKLAREGRGNDIGTKIICWFAAMCAALIALVQVGVLG